MQNDTIPIKAGTLAALLKEEEKRKERLNNQYLAIHSLSYQARKESLLQLAKEYLNQNPGLLLDNSRERALSLSLSVVESEYVSTIAQNRFSQSKPTSSFYSYSRNNTELIQDKF